MLTSILDLSELQADEVTLHPTDVGLGSSLAEAVAPFADAAKEAGITLSVATGDAPSSVYADADAFQNVISKLIHNSIKFTEPGGRVVVAARLDGGEVVVTVEDTGIGIPEAFLPDAFRPFTQASTGDDREYEGSGLGLAVAQRLVDRMQGSISIDSAVGTGTCVTVRLPAEPPQEEPPQEEPPHESPDGAEPGDPAP
jgi:signal transduction histidine kinase